MQPFFLQREDRLMRALRAENEMLQDSSEQLEKTMICRVLPISDGAETELMKDCGGDAERLQAT